ncbi:hypothetical protein [Natranaeroarchaeum aerophilus]|uniref:Uncharacterized protein n=1 Tax=Natranaeroarchaeum aerophilus TaxID=2917711 RepID=A0AAE3FTH7_9EURY|nr:hypothetical protein [Natranaeroarchaeum aerophilus]MCL9815297.1 hypothetical protein [Natranaeroarchaeum aerophilus]
MPEFREKLSVEQRGEIEDALITTQQFAVAEALSDKNTAPEDVEVVEPKDVCVVPDDDLLSDKTGDHLAY